MKTLAKIFVPLILLGVGGYFGFPRGLAYWKSRNKPTYRQAEVIRGAITWVVSVTGTIQPVLRVQVGSFVSGPIDDSVELADFNDRVTKGQILAKIDPRIYQANVARDEATLSTRKAELERVGALLDQSKNDEQRAQTLRETHEDFISDTEMDQYKYNRKSLEAQLKVAEAGILQAKASLELSTANLAYTDITSPVDGVIIDRKIDPGQTLAAQFQTPELFVVAPDMEEEMYVYATVNEAEIGRIREAKDREQKVHFTVDAYRGDLFEGTIHQIRLNPVETQNVVTYPVVVSVANPELKLLPGMTANLSFHIDKHEDVLKIPNAALRFFPQIEQVRPDDRKLLDAGAEGMDEEEEELDDEDRSATERAAAQRKRNRRHVWIIDGEFLKAVEIVTGLIDSRFTELVSGEIKEGQKLVTGIKPRSP